MIDHRALLLGAPGLLRGGRERLVELIEAGRFLDVAHVAQEHVMDPLKVPSLGRPPSVAPHNLACKAFRAKNGIADDFGVMARPRVDVKYQAAVLGEQRARRGHSFLKEAEIMRKAPPAIVEGGGLAAQYLARLIVARSSDLVVLPPREERGIDIDQDSVASALVREGPQCL
jgi:hypothetical protein